MAEPGLFLLQGVTGASPPLTTEVMHPAAIEHLILLVDAESIPAWLSGRVAGARLSFLPAMLSP